jgi:hypothetical protein
MQRVGGSLERVSSTQPRQTPGLLFDEPTAPEPNMRIPIVLVTAMVATLASQGSAQTCLRAFRFRTAAATPASIRKACR